MATVKQKVYLISEKQREALLNYLLDRPYREVAIAVQILAKAPSTNVDIEVPDEDLEKVTAALEEAEKNKDTPAEIPVIEAEQIA